MRRTIKPCVTEFRFHLLPTPAIHRVIGWALEDVAAGKDVEQNKARIAAARKALRARQSA